MNNLYKLRKEKKYTQEYISKVLHVSRATYNGYELNKYEPNIETLCKLADFYNVSIDYLVGRTFVYDVGYLSDDHSR